jgi:hypothetical protein
VPIGFLITVALPALATVAALAAVRRSWTLGQLCWRLGFQVNELPLLVATWLVAATVLTAAQGQLTTPVGLVGAGVALLTLAGLAIVVWRGLQAGPTVRRALCEGLSRGWRGELAPELTARLARHRP